jgi:hypothetical protein
MRREPFRGSESGGEGDLVQDSGPTHAMTKREIDIISMPQGWQHSVPERDDVYIFCKSKNGHRMQRDDG